MLVMCNGMGRSGSTYQYNLARYFVERSGIGESHALIAPEAQDHTHSVEDQQIEAWAKEPAYHVVKMHLVHPMLSDLVHDGRTTVLYIYRDIRDVAVSMKRAFGLRGDALVRRLDNDIRSYRQLAGMRETCPDRFLWQRYEHLMANPDAVATEIMRFLGIQLDGVTFDEILDECSTDRAKARCDAMLAELQQEVARLKKIDPRMAALLLKEIGRGSLHGSWILRSENPLLMYNHISRDKGASGVWRIALAEREIDTLQERYADWLAELGYNR